MSCPICDEQGMGACDMQREAFKREPFLPPSFELGAQWYSRDDGLEWTRYPHPATPVPYTSKLTVTAINYDRGEVVMSVSK